MQKNRRMEVITNNRIGITEEILRVLHTHNIDLISMEVHTQRICMMVEPLEEERLQILFQALRQERDVLMVNEIDILDFEKTERHLKATIDAVDEGILSLDAGNRILLFNRYCETVFGMSQEDVIGTPVEKVLGQSSEIASMIKNGMDFDNRECRLVTKSGVIDYVSTGRVIRGDEGTIIGCVASIKESAKVMALFHALSGVDEEAFREIVGASPALEKAKKTARAVARSTSTVMIRGASGTGKELFAKSIHLLSGRKGRFVTINCAAIPDSLLESELFGYEKGSFTGAHAQKKGLFEEAHEGTLFLDEIGELTPAIQAKLLRVLQEGAIRRIGSTHEKMVDVRVVVATHRNLEKMKSEGDFREDLYYRLNVIPINVPALKDRKEDIPLLVNHFIGRFNQRLDRAVNGVSTEVMAYFMEYDWPGNVRELQNTLERAVNLCEGQTIIHDDVAVVDSFPALLSARSDENCETVTGATASLKERKAVVERDILLEALRQYGSYRKVAKALGVSHTTVMKKARRYGLQAYLE